MTGSATGQTFTAARLQPSTRSIAVDAAGNSYVAGRILRPTQFGNITLIPASSTNSGVGQDVFVAKLDRQGNYLWAVRAGGNSDDEATTLALDQSGHVYLGGIFRGTARFGDTNITAPPNGSAPGIDVFVARLDASTGDWQWAVQAGGAPAAAPNGIGVDASGNVYLGGYFEAPTVKFGATVLDNPPVSNPPYYTNSRDGYVAKLSPTGAWLWAVQAGGNGSNFAEHRDMAVDAAGNCYLTGTFQGQVGFGATTLTSAPSYNTGYVAKLSPAGTWLWASTAGSTAFPNRTMPTSIAIDASGNACITGEMSGSEATFGTTTLPLTPAFNALSHLFVAKINAAGTWLWAAHTPNSNRDYGNDVAMDAAGNVYVTGGFLNQTSFGTTTLTSTPTGAISPADDAFVAKLNNSGTFQWAVRAGGNGDDAGMGLAADNQGILYVTGGASSSAADFGSTTLPGSTTVGGFWARLADVALAAQPAQPHPEFGIYPNPAHTSVTVTGLPSQHPLTLHDARGRLVGNLAVPATGKLALPAGLPAGLYLLRVGAATRSLVVE
ncbi:hypothetical protein B0919_02695 [Hymenobacter sp. CRA2]|nr:hypothetical protein B0919_02695 [Hymenobacter sp. CRA2]